MKYLLLILCLIITRTAFSQDFIYPKPLADHFDDPPIMPNGNLGRSLFYPNLYTFCLTKIEDDVNLRQVSFSSYQLVDGTTWGGGNPPSLNCKIAIYNYDGDLIFSTSGKGLVAPVCSGNNCTYTIVLTDTFALKKGKYYLSLFPYCPIRPKNNFNLNSFQAGSIFNVRPDEKVTYIQIRYNIPGTVLEQIVSQMPPQPLHIPTKNVKIDQQALYNEFGTSIIYSQFAVRLH